MPGIVFPTALGPCGFAWNEAGLTAFHLPEASADATREHLARKHGAPIADGVAPDWSEALAGRVVNHLEGALEDFADVRLDWSRVGEFQRRVLEATLRIKPGFTRSYGDISGELGLGPAGARAVGTALGANPWPLIVPCHRVISARDKMTGFSAPGGVRTKTRLLALEGAELLSE